LAAGELIRDTEHFTTEIQYKKLLPNQTTLPPAAVSLSSSTAIIPYYDRKSNLMMSDAITEVRPPAAWPSAPAFHFGYVVCANIVVCRDLPLQH